jgi:amino acid transporter
MIRGIGLRGAIAINVITMVGIGPLITIPLVLAQLAGPLALIGWIAGAIVALCDGLVWAELSSRYPGSGGTYVYLREVFGRDRWGRLLAFLFNWQFLLYAPCLLATGYIGFASYFGYLDPAAASRPFQILTAAAVGILTVIFLYRRITAVASVGSVLAVAAILTLVTVAAAAFTHADIHRAFTLPPHASLGIGFLAGLGGALYITLYDYVGYSDAALLGDEVRRPQRTIPLAIVGSIAIVAVLYVALQVGVLAHGVPSGNPQFIASTIVEQSWGATAAKIVTILILLTAFASVYGNLVGFARIPYAAARDGEFFKPFAHLNERGQFPDIALLVIGAAALVACLLPLDQVLAVLTAGIVLIQGVAQVVALFVARRSGAAPFRMWLFPIPAVVALIGWLFAFCYTGVFAIAVGIGWLIAGACAYLVTARVQRHWPFAAALLLAFCSLQIAPARAAAWPGSAVVQRNGYPVYTVSGNPFFVYGAAFFYERIPRTQWAASLAQYRSLGINTIDLYVMWNWHEVSNGTFDFTGRSNPRRDLSGLLHLIDRFGFKIILRPGPVIRNEWRNGGYPAWLLKQPAYGMPLRDVLEGRYPATATLQNQHSDDAAAEWMRNAMHMRYATRWLERVLQAVAPWGRDVIAIALDDDQGAYLDNQTWPAPHFQKYIGYLASTVRGSVGPRVPLFINTYEMKVTASAPVWAWGNWYQSDAYSIGEHDRAQLEFATGLIATQPHLPVMVSEFQAGWLQGAGEAWPRPADPTNTTLALNTMLQQGMHGVVNFPVQDTVNPAGWEAPWANAFYSWDAALSVQLTHQGRWRPTQRFGDRIRAMGTLLAQLHVKADAAIAYTASAYDPASLTKDDFFAVAQATMDAQRACRAARVTCALIDLRYIPQADLERYPVIVVPPPPRNLVFISDVTRKLAAFRTSGGQTVTHVTDATIPHPAAGRIPNAVLLVDPSERFGMLTVVNYASVPQHVSGGAILRAKQLRAIAPPIAVRARDAALIPIDVPEALLRNAAPPQTASPPPLAGAHVPLRRGSWLTQSGHDVFQDGYPAVVLENTWLRLIVSPCAGARAFVLEDKRSGDNLFTTVGGLRDAWSPQAPPSARDYIARYTHPIAAGTFNRCYAVDTISGTQALFTYFAPDAAPSGASFEKSISIARFAPTIVVKYHVHFSASPAELPQQLTSFAATTGTKVEEIGNGCGLYEPENRRIVMVAWPAADVKAHTITLRPADALLTLTFSQNGTGDLRYGVRRVLSEKLAQAALAQFAKLSRLPSGGSGGTVDAAASKAAG